jgi:hypothetical protein
MRITQGYVSKSVADFPFHQVYGLDDYNDKNQPCVFFGAYRYEDRILINHHNNHGKGLIFWTGQDALNNSWIPYVMPNVTAHLKVHKLFTDNGKQCKLVKPAAFLNTVNPQTLGKKIYAYCPSSAPDYHGKKLIDELRCGGYEIIIGDGQFTQDQWRNGQADFHYKDCFIGLCLSEFAGGGGSIIEMGLRGMKVVTNVFDLPNCISWNSIHDIVTAIEQESQFIGHTNPGLADYVWNDLDHKYQWLNI